MLTAAVITAMAAITGAATSAYGTYNQAQAQKSASKSSAQAEQLRKQQMLLESQRKQREIFRNAAAARATAVSNQNNAGASSGSAYGGAMGGIAGKTSEQSLSLAQNTSIGAQIFDANASTAISQGQAATWGGVASLGKDIFASSEKIGRIGDTMFNSGDGYGTSWATRTRRV